MDGRPGSRRWRPAAALTAVGLLAFLTLAQGWVPQMSSAEDPRPTPTTPLRDLARPGADHDDAGLAEAERAGIDVHRVIDTVRHHVSPVPGRPSTLEAGDDAYRAIFGPAGFGLSLGDAELGVSLRRVHRGSEPLALWPGPWQGDANVASRPLAPGLSEQVTARAGEVEWDVVLAAPPPGRGDLQVEAALAGTAGATRQADGWRFPLARGGTIRMGEVVVKDATGAELHRALPEVRGTRLALEVPAEVLAGAAYPLTVDPSVGPERPASGPPPAPGGQFSAAVAFDGTNHLVVWRDFRSGGSGSDIFGARVSTIGTVLDPAGIAISTATNAQSDPAVAFGGTSYLVVWEDGRSGTTSDIFGARVSTTGTVLDGPPATGGIAVSTAADNQGFPAVAFDGTIYLVVWQDFRSGTTFDIFGARVGTGGAVVDGPAATGGIPVSTAVNDQSEPVVAFDGTNYLVAWQDFRSATQDIFGARVSTGGTLLDGPPATGGIAISTAANEQFRLAVAFDGTNYLVVWRDARFGAGDIFGTRVSTGGTVLDGPPATGGIAISTAPGNQREPWVAFDGTNYLVVWQDFRSGTTFDIFGARVSTGGTVLDGPPSTGGIAISTAATSQGLPAVAFDGTNYLVVWSDDTTTDDNVFGARVTTSGSVLDASGRIISTGPSEQAAAAVAFDGTNYLVAWHDSRAGTSTDIFGARVSTAGTVLDPAGIAVSTAANDQSFPAVAFDGTNYLVVWQDHRPGTTSDIFGARVNTGGSVLDPAGIAISTAANDQRTPAVAFDGTNHLVVWSDFRSGTTFDIFGARVSTVGSLVDGPPDTGGIAISTAPSTQGSPAVASDSTNYLVVWVDTRSGTSDIFGARVTTGGTVLDGPPSTGGIAISTAPSTQSSAAVAFDGTNHLVVWQDFRSGTTFDIFGARVSTTGSLVDGPPGTGGIAISTAAGGQSSPAVAANGPFLVVWRDRRSTTFDVYGARVTGAGAVQDASGFAVSATPTNEGLPAVVPAPGDDWSVTYDRLDGNVGASRVFLRTVSPK